MAKWKRVNEPNRGRPPGASGGRRASSGPVPMTWGAPMGAGLPAASRLASTNSGTSSTTSLSSYLKLLAPSLK